MEQIHTRLSGEDIPSFVSRLEDVMQEKNTKAKIEEEKQQLKIEGARK
jgi:hypothetical protein